MDMNDTTAESRAKRLAKELKDLWEKPTTTECLRLSADAEPPQAGNVSKVDGGPAAARASPEHKGSDVPVAKKMQPARRR
ncbi:MAG TPA: hypothetical protein VFS52_21425 [Steroidobacteraceae bacterium]|nr:hypothetical protein [Steroidobacteraceae bacterium]